MIYIKPSGTIGISPYGKGLYPANIHLFKVNNRSTWKKCKICSKLTIKTPERRQWRRSGVLNVSFEHISHIFSSVSIVYFQQVNVSWL